MVMVEKEIVMKSLSEIKPYEKNPRKNDKTVELLCKMIPSVGFNVPLVIDTQNVIVKGHARYLAAEKLGMTEVPCVVTHADAESIRADRIADNKISEFSEWIKSELSHELDTLDLEYDFSDMGLPRATYDDIPVFDYGSETGAGTETTVSDEDKAAMYQKFLEQQAQSQPVVTMATEENIQKAMINQNSVPKPARNYGKCVCGRCGNVMYVDKDIMYTRNGVIRK